MTTPTSDGALDRRAFVARSIATAAALAVPAACTTEVRLPRPAGTDAGTDTTFASVPVAGGVPPRDELFELTVAGVQERMQRGALTSQALAERYLARIDAMDKLGPAVNAIIERNPDALAIAASLDAERRAGNVRGPLHGVPVVIKDNIDTAGKMRTSAGSLALAESIPPKNAFIVDRLIAAGAVIIGKTNLSEWANFRSTRSSSGWSARGGQTHNPYVLDRNPCGSSSGTAAAIAADFATVGIGTETDGSIICPSSICGLVGIKPTVGLWSRSGIIPIAASQDTAGPMTRTVADAAAVLGALTGVDSRDTATSTSTRHAGEDYTRFLDAAGLSGARIGIARNATGFNPDVDAVFDTAVAALKSAGAVVIDADLPNMGRFDAPELDVLLYEFKAGLNAYLAALGPAAPVKTLAELIAFNQRERAREMPWFGQELFERAEKKGPLTDSAYVEARRRCVRFARIQGIDTLMSRYRLDAVAFPSNQPAWLTDHLNGDHFTGGNTSFAAVAGYPSITVPMGFVRGLPVGMSLIGRAWTEGTLIRYAYAFEQLTKARQAPRYYRTLET